MYSRAPEEDKLPPVGTESLTTKPNQRSYELSAPPNQQGKDSPDRPPGATTVNSAPIQNGGSALAPQDGTSAVVGDDETAEVSKDSEDTATNVHGDYSKGYMKAWKVTATNLQKRLQEITEIVTWMQCMDVREIVHNPSKFKDSITLSVSGLYRVRNSHEVHRLMVLETLQELNYQDFLNSLWHGFVKEFESQRSEYEYHESLSDLELWERYSKEKKYIRSTMSNYGQGLIFVWNGSNIKNPKTCQLLYDSFIQPTLNILDSKYTLGLITKASTLDPPYKLSKALLGILLNFLQNLDHEKPDMRQRNALKIVSKYRNVIIADKVNLTLRSFAVLAASYLITEDDDHSSVTLDNADFVFVGKLLRSCLISTSYHSSNGFDAEELLYGLNNIAVVESNKKKLVEADILPLLVDSMRASKSSIQTAAAQIIWTIAFDDESKQRIISTEGLMTELKLLSQQDDEDVQKAAKGALWQIEGATANFNASAPKADNVRMHIMISYQWDVQEQVLKVRDKLKEAGFRVWIDVEQMCGSTLEAMAHAVQNTVCFVPVLTEKYKASPACRLEAENAYLQQKKMVPIRLQPKYRPDGWLGFMLGSTFFYDLTKPNEYEAKMEDFIKAIGDMGKIHPGEDEMPMPFQSMASDVPDGAAHTAVRPQTQQPSASSASINQVQQPFDVRSPSANFNPTKLKCFKWSASEVSSWLERESLQSPQSLFDGVDGRLLVELISLQLTSPDVYYAFLREDFKMTLKTVLHLNAALRELMALTL